MALFTLRYGQGDNPGLDDPEKVALPRSLVGHFCLSDQNAGNRLGRLSQNQAITAERVRANPWVSASARTI